MRTEIPKLVKEAPSVMRKGPSLVTLATSNSADGTVACRLDRFYISASFKSHLAACTTPCAFSDHSVVEFTLTIKNTVKKGPSYWKCNVHILSDPDLSADLEDLCNQCMQAQSMTRSGGKSVKLVLNDYLRCTAVG